MKETDIKLLCVMLMETIYNDIRKIVREELERAQVKSPGAVRASQRGTEEYIRFEDELKNILEGDD
tara:strand:+ start:450 stop:647 length:198 start_codon:yes stop_codon:yes gene_type:complete